MFTNLKFNVMKIFKDANGGTITEEEFTVLPEAAKALYTEVASGGMGVVGSRPEYVGPSRSRALFLDELKSTSFFLLREYSQKYENGEPKDRFSQIGFPEPVPAQYKDADLNATNSIINWSEAWGQCETKGLALLGEDGKINPALTIEITKGIVNIY